METATKAYEDLQLCPGASMDLITHGGAKDAFYPCVFTGALLGECLIIVPPPTTGELPGISEGEPLSLRIKLPDGIALIHTQVLYISEVPTLMVYLDFPKQVSFKQMRSEPRVKLKQAVLGYNKHHPNISAVVGSLSDISLSGACIVTEEQLGKVGEKVTLKTSFRFADVQKTLALNATIARLLNQGEQYQYGVSFGEMAEDQKVFLSGFIFQQLSSGALSPLY